MSATVIEGLNIDTIIDKPQGKRRDSDIDYDRACEDGTRRKNSLTIDDKVILASRQVKRWRDFTPAPSKNPRNTLIRQENLKYKELVDALFELGKYPMHFCENGLIHTCDEMPIFLRIRPDIVRQVPTNKPDGISKVLNPIIAKALKREYSIIGKCHVKRDGKMTATVYNIVGNFQGSKELFYILRCPVTGGTFGRTLENIHIPKDAG